MGRGSNKTSKFPKKSKFSKIFIEFKKKKKKNFFFLYFKNFKKLQNFHKISKLTYFKICISWIWYFSQNWFRWDSLYKQRFTCLLSLFNWYGGQYTMGRGLIYPWYIDPPTHSISTPLPMVYRPPYPIQLLTFNAVYSWLYGPGQWMIDWGQRPRLINHWPGPHSHE